MNSYSFKQVLPAAKHFHKLVHHNKTWELWRGEELELLEADPRQDLPEQNK